MKPTTTAAMSKSQFRCFHCRLVVSRREGNWFDWDTMQVHLCPACDKATRGFSERTHETTRVES